MTGGLVVEGLRVRFGAHVAVGGVDLAVAPGEIVAVVGPSGCGKSTLLRAVAGLERSDGRILWDGEDLSGLRPDRRRFGLMFQDHALFAHRDVAANVEFGLRMDGVAASVRAERVAEVLELVGLGGFGSRSVDSLSGGEAQRVALARALAPGPRLLMLDEPLGSLDRVLRARLTAEIRRILSGSSTAAIHVTHDQEEAYAVADRLVVMREGVVVRSGSVADVWADPRSRFVATFLGHDNVLDALDASALGLASSDPNGAVVVSQAAISLVEVDADGAMAATVQDVRFNGAMSRVELGVEAPADAGTVTLVLHSGRPPTVGARVGIRIDPGPVAALSAGGPEPPGS